MRETVEIEGDVAIVAVGILRIRVATIDVMAHVDIDYHARSVDFDARNGECAINDVRQ